MRKKIKHYLLIITGLLSVLLGIIGAILPILPTTPFLILALTCFAKSSPKFHQMLLNNPWFGESLQQWEQSRSITRATKIKAMLLIVMTFALSIGILQDKLQLQLGLLLLMSILLTFIWRLKEALFIPIATQNKN